jgi:hypothetical protein
MDTFEAEGSDVPDVVAENRLVSKQTATTVANGANATAALAATVAAVAAAVPEPTLITKAIAARFAIIAGATWVVSAYAQIYAADPPRDDFDQVTVSAASFDDSMVTDEEPLASMHRFAGRGLVLADDLLALVTSLERFDGAVDAGDTDAASVQAGAAQSNSVAAADQLDALQQLAPQVNAAWQSIRTDFSGDFGTVSLEQAQQAFTDAWGSPPDAPAQPLQDLLASVSDLGPDTLRPGGSHPIMEASALPLEPETVIGDDLVIAWGEFSTQLREIVA